MKNFDVPGKPLDSKNYIFNQSIEYLDKMRGSAFTSASVFIKLNIFIIVGILSPVKKVYLKFNSY